MTAIIDAFVTHLWLDDYTGNLGPWKVQSLGFDFGQDGSEALREDDHVRSEINSNTMTV